MNSLLNSYSVIIVTASFALIINGQSWTCDKVKTIMKYELYTVNDCIEINGYVYWKVEDL